MAKPDLAPTDTPTSTFSNDILIWDIEVSPNIGFFWSAGYKITIPFENIIEERAICCLSWKILGKKKIHSLRWDDDHNDRGLIDTFLGHLNGCRYSVAHNGDRFDLRWLRGRAMKHRLPMWPHYVTVDTLKVIRRLAYLNSNKLDYLGEYFGLGRKHHVGFQLWKDVMADKPGALDEMVRYNRRDVQMLSDLYELFQPYMEPPDRLGRGITTCPHCGDPNYIRKHHRFTKSGHERIQLQGKDCGHYWTVPAKRFFAEL